MGVEWELREGGVLRRREGGGGMGVESGRDERVRDRVGVG